MAVQRYPLTVNQPAFRRLWWFRVHQKRRVHTQPNDQLSEGLNGERIVATGFSPLKATARRILVAWASTRPSSRGVQRQSVHGTAGRHGGKRLAVSAHMSGKLTTCPFAAQRITVCGIVRHVGVRPVSPGNVGTGTVVTVARTASKGR